MPRKIVALCGSLRAVSTNRSALLAATLIEPAVGLHSLGDLPLFNPDLDGNEPESVRALQNALREADALLICSPEYAHGISGVLKNALDWVVSSGELFGKPAATINASPHSHHAIESLHEILKTMGLVVVEAACIALPLRGANLDFEQIAAHPEHSLALKTALDALLSSTEGTRSFC
jgi:chromate reductase, NAD(P)H dehydrogenase (quinone)